MGASGRPPVRPSRRQSRPPPGEPARAPTTPGPGSHKTLAPIAAGRAVMDFDARDDGGLHAAHQMDLRPIGLLLNHAVPMVKTADKARCGEAGGIDREVRFHDLELQAAFGDEPEEDGRQRGILQGMKARIEVGLRRQISLAANGRVKFDRTSRTAPASSMRASSRRTSRGAPDGPGAAKAPPPRRFPPPRPSPPVPVTASPPRGSWGGAVERSKTS